MLKIILFVLALIVSLITLAWPTIAEKYPDVRWIQVVYELGKKIGAGQKAKAFLGRILKI